jgi:hypothetical protein
MIHRRAIAARALASVLVCSACANEDSSVTKEGDRDIDAKRESITSLPHINNVPSVADFVLYADRSVSFGTLDRISGGDVGVRAVNAAAAPQAQLGGGNLLPGVTVIAPSVAIGFLTTSGVVQTNTLTNTAGIPLAQSTFPGEFMPALPVGATATPGSTAVSVGAFQIRTLSPGNYGALNATGAVLLSAGTYSFASVTLANGGSLSALPGATVHVRVAGNLSTGIGARIAPGLLSAAGTLDFSVAGNTTFGNGTNVNALVTTPNGRISFADNTVGTGAFAAHDISLGNNVGLSYQSGFTAPQLNGGAYCNPLILSAQFPLPPLVPVQGVATLPAPLRFVVPTQLPVANGTLGISAASLRFGAPGQADVICNYASIGLPVTAMQLQSCSGGVTGGSTQRGSSFTLTFASAVNLGTTAITLNAVLRAAADACDDHNLCTKDVCAPNGLCAGRNNVVCTAPDANHLPGTCQPATGTCSAPRAAPPLSATAVPPTPMPDPPPPVAGCYEYTLNGWHTVPCADPVYVERTFGRPNVELGLQSTAPLGGTATPLVYGQIETILPAVGSVTGVAVAGTPPECAPYTPATGANVFSIQGNTNTWTSADGHDKAVQFVIQSNGTTNAACVWRVDVTAQTYPHDCVMPVPAQRSGGLRAFDSANLAGYVDTTAHTLTMVAEMSWVPDGDATHYAVVVADDIGLAGNWLSNNGSMLGMGGCSQAQFANTELLTRLAVSSCAGDTQATDPTCPGAGLDPNVVIKNNSGTAETNNLTAVAAPSVSFPNRDLAVANYISTTSGACFGPSAVYVKDRDDDNGAEPSNLGDQPFWESPDIFLVPSGSPVTVDAVSSDTLINPGANYDVYVRVNNDIGCQQVTGVKALVYLADPAALSAQWVPITGGAYSGNTTAPVGGRALVGPFMFTAPSTGLGNGHKCLIAAIQADGEAAEPNNFDAPASNQVAQRNVQLSGCQYPLTNATASNGTVALTLSADPVTPTPSLTATPAIQVTFDDGDSRWYDTWRTQAGAGTAFAVTHAATQTVVRLGQASVQLAAVPINAGETRVAVGNLQLSSGSDPTTLSLRAELVQNGTTVVVNGGSCTAQPPVVVP